MKKTKTRKLALLLSAVLLLAAFAGCDTATTPEPAGDGTLTYISSMELEYTTGFSVDYYEGGYATITTPYDGKQFLLIPEGATAPEDLDDSVIQLQMPLESTLISNSPTVSLISAFGGLDHVGMVTIDRDSWYIQDVVDKLDSGDITFVGKHTDPDYELISTFHPPLTIIHTSVTTDVMEKFAELQFPMLIDASSVEQHPLARVEWIKLYGLLFGMEEEANAWFEGQKAIVEALPKEGTGKTVAVFYVTSTGPSVRKGGDYMARMVELAGGDYILSDLDPSDGGVAKMEEEEFYARASTADFVFYIAGSMGGTPQSLDDLAELYPLIVDFDAYENGTIWCTTPNFFQITDVLGNMTEEIHTVLTSEDAKLESLNYLYPLS